MREVGDKQVNETKQQGKEGVIRQTNKLHNSSSLFLINLKEALSLTAGGLC